LINVVVSLYCYFTTYCYSLSIFSKAFLSSVLAVLLADMIVCVYKYCLIFLSNLLLNIFLCFSLCFYLFTNLSNSHKWFFFFSALKFFPKHSIFDSTAPIHNRYIFSSRYSLRISLPRFSAGTTKILSLFSPQQHSSLRNFYGQITNKHSSSF